MRSRAAVFVEINFLAKRQQSIQALEFTFDAAGALDQRKLLFVEGDSNSAWARRFYDLCNHHIQDISRGLGKDALSEAQLSLIKRASSIECELERLDALLSLGEEINLDEYGRATSHLRRLFEVLGVERKPRDLSPALTYRERLEIQAEAAVEEELVDGQ